MRRSSARSGNKPIAASRLRSVVIAIFAKHSTLFLRRTIILTSSNADRDQVIAERDRAIAGIATRSIRRM
jgi:hypothetical protein